MGARRDGRGARLLRRELDGRRRRRAERDGPGGLDGRGLRHGARGARAERPRPYERHGRRRQAHEGRRDQEGRDHGAVRADRAADHEPHRKRRRTRPGSPGRRARRPQQAQAGRPAARAGIRDRVRADLSQQEGGRADRRRADREEGALRRRARRDPREREAEDPEGRPHPTPSMARSLSTRGRFAVAYLVLGAAVGAALGGLIVLIERPGPQPPPPWSSWQPQASKESSRLLEIANHVGNEYTSPSGDPLTAVKIGGPANGKNLKAILIPTKP